MPFTQSFDQFFTVFVMLGVAIYLLRTVVGVGLLIVGVIPSKLGASARIAGSRVTPRLIMKIITTLTGLLVAGAGIGASTALAAPSSPDSSSSQTGDANFYDFDDLGDLIAIDRGPASTEAEGQTKTHIKAKPKIREKTKPASTPTSSVQSTTQAAKVPQTSKPKSSWQSKNRSPVVVKQGDTLWSIAAKQLGSKASNADIDREWRRWYRANSETVGPNPDVVVPGMKLETPKS